MSNIITEGTLFKPARTATESKADATTNAARAILEDEVARREAKTARLREARLAMEAEAEEEAAKEARPAKKRKPAARKAK